MTEPETTHTHDHPQASDGAAIGWALYDSADFDGAAALFTRTLATAPDDVEALRGLGRIRMAQNDLAPAIALLEQALNLIADGAPAAREAEFDARRDLAWTYRRLGRYDLAAPLFAALPGDFAPLVRQLAAFGDRPGYLLDPTFERAAVPLAAVDPIPFIEVEVGSGSYLFALDTGSGDVVLDTGLVRDLDLPYFGERRVRYAGGQEGVIAHARLPRLGLHGLEVRDLPVEVADVRRRAPQLFGFIGTNFLARFRPTLDYAAATLTLTNRAQPFTPPPAAQPLPFWLFDDHVMLARGALGSHETMVAVASGFAGATVAVPESTVTQAGLALTLRHDEALEGVGGAGSQAVIPFTLPELRVGPVVQRDVAGLAGLFFPDLEWRYGFRVGALVGHDFLRPSRWTIDWTGMRFWLESPV